MLVDNVLVENYQEIVENIREFNRSVEEELAGIPHLTSFKHWFYESKLDMFGPAKFIGYKKMNAARYNYGHRTEQQKAAGIAKMSGGTTSKHLTKWFREIDKDDPEFAILYDKLCALHSGKKPNKKARIYVPK